MVLAQSTAASFGIEDRMAALIASRGQKVVVSSSVLPPNMAVSENFTREQLTEVIKKTGCDAVFVIALLDVKTVETYQPGTAYYPMTYGMYGSYYGYYNYYYPQVYSPGYYTTDKTYYIESSFYDVEEDKRTLDLIRERSGDRYCLLINSDGTFDVPGGDRMVEFSMRLADEPKKVKAEADALGVEDMDLEALFRYSHRQGLASRELTIEELFEPSSLELTESAS